MKPLEKAVCFILFVYLRAFNEILIFNGKSRRCNATFTSVLSTSMLAENI